MKNQIFTLADIQPKDTSDIEWQVLSDLMSDDDLLPEVVSTINQDFFSSDGRKALWNAIVTEFNKGTPVAGYVAFAQMPKEVQTEFNAYTERSVPSTPFPRRTKPCPTSRFFVQPPPGVGRTTQDLHFFKSAPGTIPKVMSIPVPWKRCRTSKTSPSRKNTPLTKCSTKLKNAITTV